MIRSGLPIQQAVAEVMSITKVTHDLRHLVLRLIEPVEIKFFPGQYVDIALPGTDVTRSFSMANTTCRDDGRLEFVIKVYPDGRFSTCWTPFSRSATGSTCPGRSGSSPCGRTPMPT
jgi:propane monooxygenase reductase subunit